MKREHLYTVNGTVCASVGTCEVGVLVFKTNESCWGPRLSPLSLIVRKMLRIFIENQLSSSSRRLTPAMLELF